LSPKPASDFVLHLVNAIKASEEDISEFDNVEKYIPVNDLNGSDFTKNIKVKGFSLGCSLLKELAFKFLTYVRSDVYFSDQKLGKVIIAEYCTILQSLALTPPLFTQLC